MGFPANLELVFTLCWILDIVRNCTHLFVKPKKTTFFVTAAENLPVFAQEVESIYLLGNYLLTRYIHYYLDM